MDIVKGRHKFSFYEALKLLHEGKVRAIFLDEDLSYPTVIHHTDIKERFWKVKE